jgi:hypothetical protein
VYSGNSAEANRTPESAQGQYEKKHVIKAVREKRAFQVGTNSSILLTRLNIPKYEN